MWPPWHWAKVIFTGCNEVVAKVMFLLVSVILSMGGVCLSACWDTTPPEQTPLSRHPPEQTSPTPWQQTPLRANTTPRQTPLEQTPPEQTPPRADIPYPLAADTPQSKHHPQADPSGADPPRADTPWSRPPQSRHPRADTPPPQKADSSIRSMSGRYASYWNAFLFSLSKTDLCRSSVWTMNWIINLWTHLEAMSYSLPNPQFAFESVTTFQCVKKFL